MENSNCNPKNSYPPKDNCFNLETLSDVLRSPRVFDPVSALHNIQIIKCGYVAVKAAVLNYLYQVSDIYEYINNSINLTTAELSNLESKYKDVVRELLASITTSVAKRLSDCSKMVAYDLVWVPDLEETDSNVDVTTSLFKSQKVTFNTNGAGVEFVSIDQSSSSVKKYVAPGVITQGTRSITISETGSTTWEATNTLTFRDVYYLYEIDGTYKAVLNFASQEADTGIAGGGAAANDAKITLNFDNQIDISTLIDGDYIVSNWGPVNYLSTNSHYVYYMFTNNANYTNTIAYLYYDSVTSGTFTGGDQIVKFRIAKKVANSNLLSAPYTNSNDNGDIFTVSGPSVNKLKLKMDDLPILAYKAFDVGFYSGSVTTFCDRPSFQILGDRSTFSIVLRTATNSEWTPVGADNYGRSGNTMYSQVSTKNAETISYVLCPSTELRKRPQADNINEVYDTEGIRYDGTATPDTIDPATGKITATYRAFGNRNNAQIFLESILTPDTSAPAVPYDISENDIVYFLGFLDSKIRQAELVSNTIRLQIDINKKVCPE